MPDSTLLMNFEIFLKTTSDYVCYIIVVLVMNDYVYNFWHITASLVFALVACWCLFKLWHKQFTHIKGNITLVLMHSSIVNGYQLMCDAHTVLEPHRGTAAFFSILLAIVVFHFFLCICCHS